jgi:hypothetical protein
MERKLSGRRARCGGNPFAASGDTIDFAAGIATIDLTTDELLMTSLTIRDPGRLG